MRKDNDKRAFKKAVCFWVACALLVVPCAAMASGPDEEETEFGKGRIYNKEGFKIDFKDIKVGETVFVYTDDATGTSTTVAKDEVTKVQISKGSKAFPYAMGYGALMFISGYVGTMNTGDDYGGEISDGAKLAIAAGVGGLGLIIGAVIGSKKTSYKTIYDEKKMGLLGSGIDLMVAGSGNTTLVGFNYSF